jgi:hypothetical protein
MSFVLYGASVLLLLPVLLWLIGLLVLRLLVLWLLVLRLLVLWLLVLLLLLEAYHELATTTRAFNEFLLDVELIFDIKLNMTFRTDDSNYFHVVVVY